MGSGSNAAAQVFYDNLGQPHFPDEGTKIEWRPSVYALIVSSDGQRILMIVSAWSKELYDLPGGGIEHGELILKALERESREETGYKVRPSSKLPFCIIQQHFYDNGTFYDSLAFVYEAEVDFDVPQGEILTPDEVERVEWVLLSDLHEGNCQPVFWPVIQQLQAA